MISESWEWIQTIVRAVSSLLKHIVSHSNVPVKGILGRLKWLNKSALPAVLEYEIRFE